MSHMESTQADRAATIPPPLSTHWYLFSFFPQLLSHEASKKASREAPQQQSAATDGGAVNPRPEGSGAGGPPTMYAPPSWAGAPEGWEGTPGGWDGAPEGWEGAPDQCGCDLPATHPPSF